MEFEDVRSILAKVPYKAGEVLVQVHDDFRKLPDRIEELLKKGQFRDALVAYDVLMNDMSSLHTAVVEYSELFGWGPDGYRVLKSDEINKVNRFLADVHGKAHDLLLKVFGHEHIRD